MGVQAEGEELSVSIGDQRGADLLSVSTGGVSVTVEPAADEPRPSAIANSAGRARFLVGVGIAVGDALAAVVALSVSDVLGGASYPQVLLTALLVPLWLALVGAFGNVSSAVIAGRLGLSRVLGSAGILGCGVAVLSGGSEGFEVRLAIFLSSLVALDLLQRGGWTVYARGKRREGRLRLRTVLVGSGDEPSDFLQLLRSEASDLLPVGRIEMGSERPADDGLPRLGRLADIASLAADGSIDCLLVASSSFGGRELTALRRTARTSGLDLRLFTKAPEALASHLDVSPLGPGALVTVRPARLNGVQAALKRGMDISGATVGLILAAPLFVVIAPMIRWSSPGPVFFRQDRVSRGGKVFKIVKLRTMVVDVDRIFAENGIDPTQPFFKPREEVLTTRVGRFLRRFSLDELPQLWNVLIGQMSLVGPRPLPVDQVLANPGLLEARHDVRAGLTGWWQVNGRSDLSADEAVRQDLFYVENWSVGLDVRIMVKTVSVLLGRRGAY